ncbi:MULTISPECIES: TetR/AcrR family transcriptional regulator C-terminal domain-containing protein [unclassified Curtobacterium]|uniref:TetR/AcrR family transcriptional regulator C-terminal domain-containing protein n=1 Tax=unclassified Curtobacterium TaxID=257496 RepID=UPI000F47B07D|nr:MULTISPECIES: TetR/AcrR family transcriptional regulator C-terminal domain-containing protein [unclassified Curtobacterium]ROQ17667.1 TetR family transcriptional regulator [Curtobacterium sp. PhB171]ROQ29088.1 TetR family transcriptional regulator [Curtobacterium sp. PhB170]ROS45768.1 TetR family transcriptional regulator [Curtobacterium sp. PhB131]ROS67930.1 TetR family transcriptional regulator [Curtobacterium sp. PhB141]
MLVEPGSPTATPRPAAVPDLEAAPDLVEATPRRRRGRPNVLSREQVIDAATAIANEDGLDRLSFRALGVRLGVAPMTVHRTIGGLDDLHGELVRRTVDEFTATFVWPDEWHAVVRTFATTFRDLMRTHPLVLESHSRRGALVSTESDAVVAKVVGALRSAGLPDAEAMYAFFVVYDFVVGHTSVEIGRGDAEAGRPERHALVGELLGEHSYDARFALGLDVLIAGIESRVARGA